MGVGGCSLITHWVRLRNIQYTIHSLTPRDVRSLQSSVQEGNQVPRKAQNHLTFWYSDMQKHKLIKVGSNTNWQEVKGKTGPLELQQSSWKFQASTEHAPFSDTIEIYGISTDPNAYGSGPLPDVGLKKAHRLTWMFHLAYETQTQKHSRIGFNLNSRKSLEQPC